MKSKTNWLRISVMSLMVAALTLSMVGFKTDPGQTSKSTTASSPWVDLVTPDLKKAETFYTSLFGWTYAESEINGIPTALIQKDGKVIGSMFEMKKSKSSVWIPAATISASDLDARVKGLKNGGAKIALTSKDAGKRGTQVVLEGKQGEEFSLISGNSYHAQSAPSTAEGNFMGAELWASDPQAASSFYQNAFGVSVSQQEFEGRPYWFFERDGAPIAGMCNNPITNQGSQWVNYIYASNPAALADKVTKQGGYVIAAPAENIKQGKVAIVQDPHGAIFCIYSNQ